MTNVSGAADSVPPVLVGGAPRSGTQAVAHLIGSHSRYKSIRQEIRVHSVRPCIPGFVRGEVEKEELVETLRGFWWKRPMPWHPETEYGLFKAVQEEDFGRAIDAFRSIEDPVRASRALVHGMLDPIARRAGKPGWVEHSPNNVPMAPTILSYLPDARFVHVVRDGLDRACSVIALPFGARTVEEALRSWEGRLRSGERAARELPADRLLVIQLEDLVLLDRERSYERLLEFLDLREEPPVRELFESDVTAERAHVGRWHVELDGAERERAVALYEEVLRRLREDGISCAPPERSMEVSHSRADSESPNPLDYWADGLALDA